MNNFVKRMAFKYRDNTFAKIFVRPFYRIKVKMETKQRRNLYLLYAPELLRKLKDSLDSKHIMFWLEFGTLLGAYRDHDFIKHDLDLDIGTFWENAEDVHNALLNSGFKILKEFKVGTDGLNGLEQTYIYKGVTVDVFYFHKENDIMYCNSFSTFPEEYNDMSMFQVKKITVPYNGFEKLKFKGIEFTVPGKIEMHLRAHYGDNFMIPNAHFDYKKEATNIHWYSRKERVAKLTEYQI